MKNKIIWVFVAVVVIGGLIWLNASKKQTVMTGEVIKIGAALGLSGGCADFGEGEMKAMELAIDEANKNGGINGKTLQLITEDTFCDGKGTASAVQKLVSVNKVDAILGPTWGDSFQSGFPISQRAGVVAISPSTAMESLEFTGASNDRVYSTWFPQRTEVEFIQNYAVNKGIKEFVVLYENDPFTEMMAKLFESEAAKVGIKISHSEETTIGASDYRTVITKVKSYPNAAVFISFIAPDIKAKFLKQFKDLGLKNTVFSSADIENQTLLNSFPGVLEGVVFGSAKITGNTVDFVNKHKAKFGTEPQGAATGQAYDAANILIEALRKGPVSDLNENITKVSVPGTTVKEVKFNDKHQVVGGGYVLKTVKDGQFVELK